MFVAPWICRSCIRRLARCRPPSAHLYVSARSASHDSGPHQLHPSLLSRARTLAAEHASLAVSLASSYDGRVAVRLGELSQVASALEAWDAAHASAAELRSLLGSADDELRALAADELDGTAGRLVGLTRRLEVALMPRHPHAAMPCMVEIVPGPGGIEGRFFADSLLRMYRQFCAREGVPATVVKYELADGAGGIQGADGEAPLLEAVLEIGGADAYDRFRTESGMHRVQRVPSTERQGRIHTSAVAVWVLPAFSEAGGGAGSENVDDPSSDFYLAPAEVTLEAMRARGAGGQSVNKTESAVRITHLPTGITVSMQDSRSKQRNREIAYRVLRSRVAERRRDAREEETARLRDSVLARTRITRADKVRTYNFPQDRVTDHRSGETVHNLPDVMAGGEGLGRVMAGVRGWLVEREMAAVVEEEEEARGRGAESGSGKR